MELSEGRNIRINKEIDGKMYSTFDDFLQMGKDEAVNTFGIRLGKYNTFEEMAMAKGWHSVEFVIIAITVICTNWDGVVTDYSMRDFHRWLRNLKEKVQETLKDAVGFDKEKYDKIRSQLVRSREFYTLYDEELEGMRRKGLV